MNNEPSNITEAFKLPNYSEKFSIGFDIAKLLSPVYECPYSNDIMDGLRESYDEYIKRLGYLHYIEMKNKGHIVYDYYPFIPVASNIQQPPWDLA